MGLTGVLVVRAISTLAVAVVAVMRVGATVFGLTVEVTSFSATVVATGAPELLVAVAFSGATGAASIVLRVVVVVGVLALVVTGSSGVLVTRIVRTVVVAAVGVVIVGATTRVKDSATSLSPNVVHEPKCLQQRSLRK